MTKPTPTTLETSTPYSAAFAISRYKNSRHWAIHAPDGSLVCVAVYKKGAAEVARRLNARKEQGP